MRSLKITWWILTVLAPFAIVALRDITESFAWMSVMYVFYLSIPHAIINAIWGIVVHNSRGRTTALTCLIAAWWLSQLAVALFYLDYGDSSASVEPEARAPLWSLLPESALETLGTFGVLIAMVVWVLAGIGLIAVAIIQRRNPPPAKPTPEPYRRFRYLSEVERRGESS